jgi:hypothetical protein
LDQVSISRSVRVAAGAFAPGHLGELTRVVPFEMVDDVLERTGRVQARVRVLPARVVVYLLVAAALFADLGYTQVWDKLCVGLGVRGVARRCASALRRARVRLGAGPLRALFALVSGPAPALARGACTFRGLVTCAIDGTILYGADSRANRARFPKHLPKHRSVRGEPGYPRARPLVLVACGTRSVIGAVLGTDKVGEAVYAEGPPGHLPAGILLLADRNLASQKLTEKISEARADLLIRVKVGRKPPSIGRLADGTHLARIGGHGPGDRGGDLRAYPHRARYGTYRSVTTLTDSREYPALCLVRLHHERREVETCHAELKDTMSGGRVLRARTPEGVEQELYALLTVYQLPRTVMTDATDSVPDTDPDRASFTLALQASRDQLILAHSIIADEELDLVGAIGRRVLQHLQPARRERIKQRIAKRALPKYNARSPAIDRTTYKSTLSITVPVSPE